MIAAPVSDLPAPDSPTTPKTSPGAIENEMSSTATSVPRRVGNSMRKWRTSSNGGDDDTVEGRAAAVIVIARPLWAVAWLGSAAGDRLYVVDLGLEVLLNRIFLHGLQVIASARLDVERQGAGFTVCEPRRRRPLDADDLACPVRPSPGCACHCAHRHRARSPSNCSSRL